jgi:hypothetical protein
MAPDALPEDLRAVRPLGWTTGVIAVACVGLLLFNATSVRSWISDLPPGRASLAARRIAEQWWATTSNVGLAWPRSHIAALWRDAKALGWPSRPAPSPDVDRDQR